MKQDVPREPTQAMLDAAEFHIHKWRGGMWTGGIVLELWHVMYDAAPPSAERDYPTGNVVGPCICGGWPGGPCLHCPLTIADSIWNEAIEAAAKVCDDRTATIGVSGQWVGGCMSCALAIRALKRQSGEGR
jgi:hypothetical protein